MSLPVSLVLAAYNSAQMLKVSLPENLKAGFAKIIIVDGFSTDDTRSYVEDLSRQHPGVIEFFQIPKKGLANARQFGNGKLTTEFVLHTGPDNIIPAATLAAMVELTRRYDLVSCQTELYYQHNYLDRAHNLYKRRYTAGEHDVVGTPYLGRSALFQANPYNEQMLNSDDTEFCHRLRDQGKKIYRSPDVCYEIGFNDLPNIVERWMRWGRGDALFYNIMKDRWGLWRKVQSWCHPVDVEIAVPFRVLRLREFVYALPLLLMVAALRYAGWMRYALFRR